MNGKYLTLRERIKIETMLKLKVAKKQIAEILKISLSTLYNEIKRGMCQQIVNDKDVLVYCADYAQNVSDKNQARKGCPCKAADNPNLMNFIEECIGKKMLSPDVTAFYIRKKKEVFGMTICTKTIYNYLDKMLFKTISNQTLIVKRNKRKKEKKGKAKSYRTNDLKYRSIEERPEEVNSRESFGNWEMDTVYSGKENGKVALLVLTERKTRFEIIRKIKDRTMESVKEALDRLEEKLSLDKFRKIFRTITVDNGVEFSRPGDIEGIGENKRTEVYYCHPYASGERGTNENLNRMIRWFIPKGSDIGSFDDDEISFIQEWLNNYPRRILEYNTPLQLLRAETATF